MPETASDSYFGPIKCPNCESFVDDEARVCPYCSMSLAKAPWRQRRWNPAEIVIGTIIGMVLMGWTAWQSLDGETQSAIARIFADRD